MIERKVRLRCGGASDVGQLRSVNQDSYLIADDRFIVADGMGGHQGGEVASATAIESLADAILETTADGPRVLDLITAVQDANRVVYERGQDDPALAGMGTTLVAIAVVVEDGEERIAIVNIGDSRAYLLSGNAFDQISRDHSLVADLVREGRITAEEAERHPQRNIITRSLGIDVTADVDDFQILPRTGDRYLLCSDGLTNEVSEADIATVLRTIDDPDAAAAELIRRANEHGGRDNITAVIVDVIDDGGLARAVPDAENFSHEPGRDTQTFVAVPAALAADPPTDPGPASAAVSADAAPSRRRRRRTRADGDDEEPTAPRVVTVRSIAFVVLILAVFGGAYFVVNDYARNSYFVTVDNDDVVIFRGRPGGFLWIDPREVEVTDITRDEVPAVVLDDLESGVTQGDLRAARIYVDNLADQIDEITPPVTTTTSTTTVTTPGSLVPVVPLTLSPTTSPTTAPIGG